jgi:hypothetical protein
MHMRRLHLLVVCALAIAVIASCAGGQSGNNQPDGSVSIPPPESSCQDYCTGGDVVCTDKVHYAQCTRDADGDRCYEMSDELTCDTGQICNTETNQCCTPNCAGVPEGGSDGCGGKCSGTTCTPTCSGKACGAPDGCGGFCAVGSGCTQTCTPSCAGRLCGSSNGCGGTCTEQNSNCTPPMCTPSCTNKSCGQPDGCGGTCTEQNSNCIPRGAVP